MIAIIGGGIAGLTAAIRLVEQGQAVHLFEAAPNLGGRTRSFIDKATGQYCDNGPHLMIGAYHATRRLLDDCGAGHYVHWQKRLELPLWDRQRRHMCLRPTPLLPLPMSMLFALPGFPGHDYHSAFSVIRLMRNRISGNPSVDAWINHLQVPQALRRDLLLPLCLGVMNEYPNTAPAQSFQRVLRESFARHDTACLGWFTKPLSTALIEPLQARAIALGVQIHTDTLIREIKDCGESAQLDATCETFSRVILTTPAWASLRIRGLALDTTPVETRPITNLHLFYKQPIRLGCREPLLGGIGTLGQWFFDVSAQMTRMEKQSGLQHIAVVISADQPEARSRHWQDQILDELAEISGQPHARHPVHIRLVQEKRATVLTRPALESRSTLPAWLIDASERPRPGDLPATIEAAVQRGEYAALNA